MQCMHVSVTHARGTSWQLRLRHMLPHVEACHACVLNTAEPPHFANVFAVDRGLNKDQPVMPFREDLTTTFAGS